jgi:hypothetical protein
MKLRIWRQKSKRALNTVITSAFLATQLLVPITMSGHVAADNNGTLKVHEFGTPSDTESNDPKVCDFNFEGFGFDDSQSGLIVVEPQGGDSDTTDTANISFGPTNSSGYYQTIYINNNDGGPTLSNGHYKSTLYGKDQDGHYTIDLKAKSKVFKVDCNIEIAIPAQPNVTDPCGPNNASWVEPADGNHVTWAITNGHLVATTASGYEFTDGTTTHDYGVAPDSNTACVVQVPVPATPTSTDPCGPNNASWNKPSDTDQITWTISNGHLIASTKTGYVFTDGKTTHDYGTAHDSNTACPSSLTIVKDARPDSSKAFWFDTNAQHSDFSLFDNGSGNGNTKTFTDIGEGWYYVNEHDAHGWTLKDISCSENVFYYRLGDKLVVYLKAGHNVTCTFVNTRDTGKIKVVKHLVPRSDNGRFNLNVDGNAEATNVGDNGTTGWVVVDTGYHGVSESATDQNTNLNGYISTYSCFYEDGWSFWNPWGHKPVTGYGTSVPYLKIDKGDKVTCIFKNIRIPSVTPGSATSTQPTCEEQSGSYTIPETPGVDYYVSVNNGASTKTAAGTYDAVAGSTVVVTPVAQQGYVLPDGVTPQTFTFNTVNAEDCVEGDTDVCPNIDGSQATVPDGMTKDPTTGVCATPGGKGGEVLSANTLVNTGESTLASIVAGVLAISVALGLTMASRRQSTNNR